MRKRTGMPLYCTACGTEQKRPRVVTCRNPKCAAKEFTTAVSGLAWSVLMMNKANRTFLHELQIATDVKEME